MRTARTQANGRAMPLALLAALQTPLRLGVAAAMRLRRIHQCAFIFMNIYHS